MVTLHMTTVQEPPNGHHPLPPPCSLPDPPDHHRSKDSSDNNSNPDSAPAPATRETETFAANAYHVPPKHYAPRVNSYQGDDFSSFDTDTNPLPERCQFMFSDGRQCAMARSDIHPSLCRFHSEREEQLFGDPAPGGNVVGRALDLPELYSACRDLTTAAGVNRALAQVFRLLAQRRISRQEAATFGHLAHLLLRTISAMHVLAGESHGHQELSPVNKVAGPADQQSQQVEQPRNGIVERQKEVALSRANKVTDPTRSGFRTPVESTGLPRPEIGVLSDEPERRTSHVQSPANKRSHPATIVVPSEHREPGDLSVSSPVKSVHSGAPPAVAPAASLSSQASQNEDLRNSRVQLAQNEHLRKVVT